MSIADPPTVASEGSSGLVGRTLDGRYRILAALGEGGLGQVFVAEHLRLGRRMAIKVLHEHFQETVNLRARFEREARALATLQHPNIVTITDYGIDEGLPYIVMELVEGRDLMKVLADGPLEPRRALGIMRQILRSLAYAHGKGIVHRDLKPANVLLRLLPGSDDHVEVLDFGLAKFVDSDESAPTLTKTGVVVGTPAYMPPEQASGEAVDARADVYAAGLILFEMLSGKRPYAIGDRTERLRQQLLDKPPKLATMAEGATVDPMVDAVIARALALHPTRRYADGAEMLAAVEALPDDCVRWPGQRPTATTLALARARRPLAVRLAGYGAAALACMGVGAGLHAALAGEPTAALPAPTAATAPRDPSVAALAASPPAAVPVPSALAVPPFPPELAEYVAKVDQGRPLSKNQETAVRRHHRVHPDDAGAAMLMARSYYNQQFFADALEWYQTAFDRDPRVKNHDGVLFELLRILRTDRTEPGARQLIARMYGADAIPAVEAQIAEERNADDRAALVRLRGALAATR